MTPPVFSRTNEYHSVVMSVRMPSQYLSDCEVHTPRGPVVFIWCHCVCQIERLLQANSCAFLYHLPPGFLSHRKEEPLPELFPQTPVSGYSWPRRTQVAHKVVSPSCSGLPCRLVHSRGVHSVTRFVHLLSLNRAMCPAHPCIPFLITSMISFTHV